MQLACLSPGKSLHRLHRFMNPLKRHLSLLIEHVPRCRELHRPGMMLKQANTQLLLQIADLPAQGRLGNVKLRCCLGTNKEAHRNTALEALQQLDPGLADEQLLRLLKKAPKTSKGEYWTDQDATLGILVSSSAALFVWQELHNLLDRYDMGMRMELIHSLSPSRKAPPGIVQSYFAIYDRCQSSTEIRDESTSEKFSGPGAGFPHTKIAMRDFLHQHWARWLKLELEDPEEGATADEWQIYRNAVSRAVQRYHAGLK